MPVPKRRTSKSRRDKRRTHDKAVMPAVSTCSNCGEAVKPHNICGKCGHYNGKKVLEIKE
ncbi:MAG TPA: 50S ribosomal protein L32 [Candidatus Cloacimonadota bacterium]|nr:50S ribosomal protein L32 [Candidatus Cloacimonadota bacterium]